MPANLREAFNAITPVTFEPYLYDIRNPIDPTRLRFQYMEGPEREGLRTVTAGDASLVLVYQNSTNTRRRNGLGAVASLSVTDNTLNVVQLQGGRHVGYRVNQGMRWVDFFGDRIRDLAEHPLSTVQSVQVPEVHEICGNEDATRAARERFSALARRIDAA